MTSKQYWWPDQLDRKVLRQNSPLSDPMGLRTWNRKNG